MTVDACALAGHERPTMARRAARRLQAGGGRRSDRPTRASRGCPTSSHCPTVDFLDDVRRRIEDDDRLDHRVKDQSEAIGLAVQVGVLDRGRCPGGEVLGEHQVLWTERCGRARDEARVSAPMMRSVGPERHAHVRPEVETAEQLGVTFVARDRLEALPAGCPAPAPAPRSARPAPNPAVDPDRRDIHRAADGRSRPWRDRHGRSRASAARRPRSSRSTAHQSAIRGTARSASRRIVCS